MNQRYAYSYLLLVLEFLEHNPQPLILLTVSGVNCLLVKRELDAQVKVVGYRFRIYAYLTPDVYCLLVRLKTDALGF